MVDVTYVGPFAAVEIEARPGTFVVVKQGESVQVADKVAKGDADLGGLLDQPGNWQAETKPVKPEPKPKP